jgi:hypothetical protein
MAIRSFNVGGQRGLRRAAAENLPNLLGIAGPNGSGKSTLLEQLRAQRGSLLEPGSELLYVGPHRTWRSSSVSEVSVLGFDYGFGDVLKHDAIPGFTYVPPGGLQWLGGLARQSASADDAQALVKTAIIRIRNKQQKMLAREFTRQGGEVRPGTVPDFFAPFAELVTTLLPHLQWIGVDDTSPQNIRCIFRNSAREDSPLFDIDDLSSGEKAAIGLFLPFIERRVARLEGHQQATRPGIVPVTVLLDEPELHLHPLLQLNALEYMRALAREDQAQFIFATQSPTLLDALDDDELFLLTPAELEADNQLSRLTDSRERLELARSITGSTHLLTRCKPIVFLEGEPDERATVSDQRLVKLLLPDVAHWAFVSARGKTQVVRAATDMRGASLHLPGMPIFGLVDADQGSQSLPDFIVQWPVAMVENLLLDVDVIFAVIEPYQAVTGPTSPEQIYRELLALADGRREEEERLRLKALLPSAHLSGDTAVPDEAEARARIILDSYLEQLRALDLSALQERVRHEVEAIIASGQQLDRFHGKRLLRSWYGKNGLADAGLGWNAFLTELARRAAESDRVHTLAGAAIDRIRLYFPQDVIDCLRNLPPDAERDRLLAACQAEREAWSAGNPRGDGREILRRRLIQVARSLLSGSSSHEGRALMEAATAIGTL